MTASGGSRRAGRRVRAAAAILTTAGIAAAPAAGAGEPGAHAAAARDVLFGGYTVQDYPVVLHLSPDRKKLLEMKIFIRGKCDDGQGVVYSDTIRFATTLPETLAEGENVLVGTGRVPRNGPLRADGVGSVNYGPQVGEMSETLRATIRANRASGTFSATIVLTNRQTDEAVATCETGTRRWTAVSAPGRVFAGETSQHHPVVVTLDARRRKVEQMRIGWDGKCKSGNVFSVGDRLQNFGMRTDGSFGDTFTNDIAQQGGGKQSYVYELAGRARGRGVTGTLKVTETDTDAAGATTDTCDTGVVGFTGTS
jgi:hypothetical protein